MFGTEKNTLLTLNVVLLFCCVRMPIWPCENEWEGSRKAGDGRNRGPDTGKVSNTLASQVLAYPANAGHLGSHWSWTGSRSLQGNVWNNQF